MITPKLSARGTTPVSNLRSSVRKNASPKKAFTSKPTRAAMVVLVARQFGFDQISLAIKDQPAGLMAMRGSGLAIELRSLLPHLKRTQIFVSETVIVFRHPMRGVEPMSVVDIDTLIKFLASGIFEVRGAAE